MVSPLKRTWARRGQTPVQSSAIGQAVQNFIQTHKRLIVFEFSVATPELNPAEFIWTQVTEYVAGTAPHNKYELQANVFAGISRIRVSQKRLFACLHGSKIDWAD